MSIIKAGNIDYAGRRVRHGKTAKDRRSGALSRALANKASAAEWHNDKKKGAALFPSELLRGNGNGAARRPDRRPGKAVKA